MNINTNPDGLPDVADLEKLANALFSALPGQAIGAGIPLSQTPPTHEGFNVSDPPTSLRDPHFQPSAGSLGSIPSVGLSPAAFSPEHLLSLGNATLITDSHFPSIAPVPPAFSSQAFPSATGTGISPNAVSSVDSL
ncbi:MAG: hypothetical protein K2Q22_04450, partial [Cytophagales bacterium]|nr:hypothetical protein [Cytophagales bacterium]